MIKRYNNLPSSMPEGADKSSLRDGLDELSSWYDLFYVGGLVLGSRELSAYGLRRYGEGRGGTSIFPYERLFEKQAHNSVLNYFEPKIANILPDLKTGISEKQFITDNVFGKMHGLKSDIGFFLGVWRVDAIAKINFSKDENGNVSGYGKMYFTISDLYDWNPKKGMGTSLDGDWANHRQLYDLVQFGAKPFRIRAYYEIDIIYSGGKFEYSSPRNSPNNKDHIEPKGPAAIPADDDYIEDLR